MVRGQRDSRLFKLIDMYDTGEVDRLTFSHLLKQELLERVIGDDIDLVSKYEGTTVEPDGSVSIPIVVDPEDTPSMIGNQMVHLSQFADDMGRNHLREEQRDKLDKFIG